MAETVFDKLAGQFIEAEQTIVRGLRPKPVIKTGFTDFLKKRRTETEEGFSPSPPPPAPADESLASKRSMLGINPVAFQEFAQQALASPPPEPKPDIQEFIGQLFPRPSQQNLFDVLAGIYSPTRFAEAQKQGMTGGEFLTGDIFDPRTLLGAAGLGPPSGQIGAAAVRAGATSPQAVKGVIREAQILSSQTGRALPEVMQFFVDAGKGFGYTAQDLAGLATRIIKEAPEILGKAPRMGFSVERQTGGIPKRPKQAAKPLPGQAPMPEAKQSYQMGLLEYGKSKLPTIQAVQITDARQVKSFSAQHIKDIKGALERGDDVPLEVLQEYRGTEWADKAIGAKAAMPEAAPKAAEVAKEPWMMTREEYNRPFFEKQIELGRTTKAEAERDLAELVKEPAPFMESAHKRAVQKALSEGKPVPSKVLKDYPDLAAGVKQAAMPEAMAPAQVPQPIKQFSRAELPKIIAAVGDEAQGKRIFDRANQLIEESNKAPADARNVVGTKSEAFESAMREAPKAGEAAKAQVPISPEATLAEKQAALKALQDEQAALQKRVNAMTDKEYKPQAKALDKEDARLTETIDQAQADVMDAEDALKARAPAPPTVTEPLTVPAKAVPAEMRTPQAAGVPEAAGKVPEPIRAQPPVEPPKPPSEAKIPEPPPPGQRRTPEEARAVVGRTSDWFFSEESDALAARTQEMFQAQRAKRAAEYSARIEELRNDPALRNLSAEQLERKAMEGMKGPLKRPEATLSRHITEDVSDAMFDMAYHQWHGIDAFEEMSTVEALRNALAGKGIPRKRGTGTKAFPEGGSAYDRLAKLFEGQPKLLEELEKGKSLDDLVQQKLLAFGPDVPWQDYTVPPPVLLDQPTLFEEFKVKPPTQSSLTPDYTSRTIPELINEMRANNMEARRELIRRQLARMASEGPAGQDFIPSGTIYKEPVAGQLTVFDTLFDQVGPERAMKEIWAETTYLSADTRQSLNKFLMAQLDRAEKAYNQRWLEGVSYQAPPGQPSRLPVLTDSERAGFMRDLYEGRSVPAPILQAMGQTSLLPIQQQAGIVRILKEAGLTTIDIGNGLRAMKASFDNSWWRQNAPLILNHKRDFVQANVDSWRAVFNEKAAKESWDAITKGPLYHLYDKLGIDFLRPYELKAGMKAAQGVEEYGFLTKDRPIPNFVSKLPWVKFSQRGFVTGINSHNWRIFSDFYEQQLQLSKRIAQGKVKLKPGESFSIEKNLKDFGTMLEDMSGRAKLGPLREMAPAINAGFFSMRLQLGRILTPRHLVSANPFVRREAWKDLATFVGGIGGVMVLGKQLGLWDVDYNSNSPTFARIRMGNTYFDPWGGYQKFVRFTSQIVTGQGISTRTGRPYERKLIGALTQLMESMAAPLPSLGLEFSEGKTYAGEAINIKDPRQWAERIAPLLPTDIYEAFVESGPVVGALSVPFGIQGIGTQSYKTQNYDLIRKWDAEFSKYNEIPTDNIERQLAGIKFTRAQYRKKNPAIDAKLFLTSQVQSLESVDAARRAYNLIATHQIDPEAIKAITERKEYLARLKEAKLPLPERTPLDILITNVEKLKR